MGNVVKLDQAAKSRSSAQRGKGRARRAARRSKTALVLGGGGFTGGVYEIGALRALDLLSVNRTVNQFDVYVGTSAGSFVAALAANGITPEEMMRVVNQQVPTPFRDIDVGTLLRPNVLEFAQDGRAAAATAPRGSPRELAPAARRSVSVMDVVLGLAEGAAVRHLLRLGHRATTCARCSPTPTAPTTSACSSTSSTSPRPTSTPASGSSSAPTAGTTSRSRRAVRASTALPMVYKPVRVNDRELVDGGIVSTTNLDIAVEAGAKFVVVVNPLVPVRQRLLEATSARCSAHARGTSATWASPQIGYQAFKLLAYQRLHEMARQWEERYPGVDIVLIEPEPDDELMFQTSIMNFTQARRDRPPRLRVGDAQARRGLRDLQARSASATASRSPPRACARSSSTSPREKEKTRAWRKILEQTTGALLRQSGAPT